MEIELYNFQEPNFDKLKNILKYSPGAFNLSKAGLGKTIVTLRIAKHLDMPIFVVCPKSVIHVWETESVKYGIKILHVTTYSSFSSKLDYIPKHGYLNKTRTTIKYKRLGKDVEKHKVKFSATDKLIASLESGFLFVIDEFQEVKNNSIKSKSISAVIKQMLKNENRSKFMFLSRTPMECPKHALNVMRVTQIINKSKLYNISKKGNFKLKGMKNVIKIASNFDKENTDVILNEDDYNPITAKNIDLIVVRLFIDIIIPNLSSVMIDEKYESNIKNNVMNGFYRHENSVKYITDGINLLEESAKKFLNNNKKSETMGSLIRAMYMIELGKVSTFFRIANLYIEKNPKGKVIIALKYSEPIENLYMLFISNYYKCAILDGSTTLKKRKEIITKFQEDSDKLQILVTQIRVSAAGISLHDIHGNRPRMMLISPTYEMSLIYQASMRIYRQGLKSDVETKIVYLTGYKIENELLKAIAQKSKFLTKFLNENDIDKDTFPLDYETYIEE